jgi:hypothetical protein
MDRIPYGEARFYRSMLIQCQSYHGDYEYFYGGAAMSGGDGMNSSTQVCVVRCVSVPVVMSYHARHLMSLSPEDLAPVALPGIESPRAWLPVAWVHSELGTWRIYSG